MTILELREKRAKAWEAAKAFLDSHRNDKGILSAEDDATYTRMEQDITDLGKEIARLERQEALDAELSKPTAAPLTGKPLDGKGDERTGRAADEYRASFWDLMRTKNPTPQVVDALRIGADTEGGYLVPDEYERTLVTLGSFKLGTTIKISEELLNDSVFDLEDYIAREFARRIGNKEEEAFFTGDGSGKPLGLLADKGGADVGVTAASATAITADELLDLYFSLLSPYRKKATWVVNDSTIKAIRKLKDNNGQYLWQPGLIANAPDTILGRPVKTSAFMPSIAAGAKSIIFGDFKYYWIADRQGRTFKRLNELYATTGQVGFLASQRVDGKLILPEALKVLKQKAGSGS